MFKKSLVTILMAGAVSFSLPAYGEGGRQDVVAQPSQPRTVSIFKFAVQSESASDSGPLSSQACPQDRASMNSTANSAASAPGGQPKEVAVDPKILDAISNELQKAASKKNISVLTDPDPASIPVGSLVITGCVFRAEKGSAAGRMIGMNVGASRLGAHIVLVSKTVTGFTTVDSFDLQVKGGSALPPLGPAGLLAHAAMQPRQTLSANAQKLAERIVKKLDSDKGRNQGKGSKA